MNSVKLQDTEINVQKPSAVLYANNETAERQFKKTIPFTTASKAKEAKDPYSATIKH